MIAENPINMRNGKTVQPNGKARILLVDDHAVVRFALQQLINRQPDLEICGEAEEAAQAMMAVTALQPDLVLVDLSLKHSSGLELMRNIKALHPKLPMLVLSTRDEHAYADVSFRAGARGYLMKDEAVERILTAIREVLAGKVYLSAALQAKKLQLHLNGKAVPVVSPVDMLTDRELEVFQLIGHWKRTHQIAAELHLSVKTVEFYRVQIKRNLGCDTAAELVQFATTWARTKMDKRQA